MNDDEQINRVAKMMAAAYWRGRLHGYHDGTILEELIASAAEKEMPKWKAAARYAVTGVPPIPMCQQSNDPSAAISPSDLRASMTEVARLLRQDAARINEMAKSIRYDEPRRVRYALEVHALLIGDLASELERPGQTKYSPKYGAPASTC